LAPLPAAPLLRDVGPALLGCVERLFLYVSPTAVQLRGGIERHNHVLQ
jgi:hypothetical protein